MIYTSYFAAMKKMTPYQRASCVSISLYTPKGICIPRYEILAPKKEILKIYKETHDEKGYTIDYNNYLRSLDPKIVENDLKNRIILCFESPEKFCHRHLVAKWLNDNGIKCEELRFKEKVKPELQKVQTKYEQLTLL